MVMGDKLMVQATRVRELAWAHMHSELTFYLMYRPLDK